MVHANAPPNDETTVGHAWHALSPDDALDIFDTDPENGLDQSQVDELYERFGPNEITQQAERGLLGRLLSQFNNLFLYLLIAAGIVTGLLGHWLDSAVIFAVVLIIALVGFIQEGRAERALVAVRGMLSTSAKVRREGERREIPADAIVPGDVVLLEAGDRVPADVRLLDTRNLQAQEAPLTGESTAVAKQVDAVDEEAELGDRASMAFSGTIITAGKGAGLAVATGDESEIGRISGMIAGVETLKTPLMRRLDAFARIVTILIVAVAVVSFFAGVIGWGEPWGEMFLAAVSIAVAAIPEGLPAVMTVTLAIGVERMARRKAIIRQLPAVETLGSVTVICSDKTGTLTRNEMTVQTLRTADDDIRVEGVGYEPIGDFRLNDEPLDLDESTVAREMIRAGLLCNDAKLRHDDGEWTPAGDPMEAALIVLAHKAGLDPDREDEQHPRRDVTPFASERRYMATVNERPEDKPVVYVKGAPEQVLDMCDEELRSDGLVPLDQDAWHERIDEIAARGQRVLAVAHREIDDAGYTLNEEDGESGLVFLGLFGLIDPPREEAVESVHACQRAGIQVKMITGDHAATALAIARDLGLDNTERALTGRDLDAMGDEELRNSLEIDVFARASPEHKLRLVGLFQEERHIIAMTGDGVNDAPALKRADIGIAMGQKGTAAAREAAAMVLADDNFASIQRAIQQGRTVYDNLKKAILFILPTNTAQALVIMLAIFMGRELPVTPVQILWINMVTAVTLALALAWERAEGNIMARPPRRADEPFLTGFMIWRVGFVGLLLVVGTGLLFIQEQARGDTSIEYARTIAINTLVLGQIVYLFNVRYFQKPAYTRDGLFGNRVVLYAVAICAVLQLLLTYAPFMNQLFHTEPLGLEAWARCFTVALAVFVLVELEKFILRRRAIPPSSGDINQPNSAFSSDAPRTSP